MKTKLLLPAMLISTFLAACATQPPLQTVPQVDLKRYSGKWYEIARYPNFFQKHCSSDITAEYAPQADGSIRVVNSCLTEHGVRDQAIGKAVVVPQSGGARLKVRFSGVPFTGDYWIIGLDEKNYSWAVVGHPSRKYLWVLARQPSLPDETAAQIKDLIRQHGYDPQRLVTGMQ